MSATDPARTHSAGAVRSVGVAGQGQRRRTGSGVLRACAMTLVAAGGGIGGCERRSGDTLAALMPRASQPRHRDSRFARRRSARSLRAFSRSAGCRSGSAGRSAASRSKSRRPNASLPDLAGGGAAAGGGRSAGDALVPRRAPVLLCRISRSCSKIAHKLVLDSAAFPDPARPWRGSPSVRVPAGYWPILRGRA